MSRSQIDWDQIKMFLQVAESGSLSKAAQQLALSQPTLSRQIQQLEQASGVQLFKRSTRGLDVTEQASELLESAQAMQMAAERFSRQISGMDDELRGDVRISVSEIIGVYYLPQAITDFQLQHPQVNFEVVISNQTSSLSKREADIALRMFRPQQPDLVCRRLPDLEIGFYAHRNYLPQAADTIGLEQLANYRFIGYDSDLSMIKQAREMGYELSRDSFSLRCDSLIMQLALIQARAGFGITHVRLAQTMPELVRLFRQLPLPALEFWCVCHRDVQYSRRIRTAMRFFSDWFCQKLA